MVEKARCVLWLVAAGRTMNFSEEAKKRVLAVGTHEQMAERKASAPALAAWKDLLAKKTAWVTFLVDENSKEIVVDKTGAEGAGDFDVSVLNDTEPRYIGVRKGDHFPILVLYMPEGCKGAPRMSYGGAFLPFRKSLGNAQEVMCSISCVDVKTLPEMLAQA
eukprot:g55102.t1